MQNVFLLVTKFTVTSIPVYRNYLYERLGAHLIFYLSEGGGGGSFEEGAHLSRGSYQKI